VPEPVSRGRLFEEWVVAECFRLVDYRLGETRLYYWRTNHGAEVDLLFERHGRLRLAAEIKAKRQVVGADIEGLRSFADAHAGVPRVVVSLAPEPYRLEGIEVLPYRRFFDRLEERL
jgi:predicted AAA+ superfamily ATPase